MKIFLVGFICGFITALVIYLIIGYHEFKNTYDLLKKYYERN